MTKICHRFQLLVLILLIFIFNIGFSQNYFGIKIGTSYPFVNYEHSRRFGAEFGINYGRKISEKLFIETGLNTDLYGRSNNPIRHEYKGLFDTIPRTITEDGSFLRFSAHIPIILNYITSINNLRFNTGLLLSGRNLLTFTNYTGMDPEVGYNSNRIQNDFYMMSRRFGIEWQIGSDYRIIGSFLFSINYRTSLGNYFYDDGLIIFGFKYNIKDE